jgi:hypothetical protein
MGSHQRVQFPHAHQAVGDPPSAQDHPILVQQTQVGR